MRFLSRLTPTLLPHASAVLALLLASSCANPPPAKTTPANQQPTAATPETAKPARTNAPGQVTSITLGEFFPLQQSGKTLIYDARAPFFYHLGHIPGAINLPRGHCDKSIPTREAEIKAALAAGKTIVVYCSSITCADARIVALRLASFGYPARIFPGGWEEWRTADLIDE
jgi:3-mercaptopyruvate sulfurtransferase SseA